MQIINNDLIKFKNNIWAILCIVFALVTFSFSVTGEENEQEKPDKTDSEILKSLDAIKNQINNDIFLIEEENDMKENDHFDNINIESIFSDNKLNGNSKNSISKNHNSEQKIINMLDKSDLMNFEDNEDAWWRNIIEDVEIEDID